MSSRAWEDNSLSREDRERKTTRQRPGETTSRGDNAQGRQRPGGTILREEARSRVFGDEEREEVGGGGGGRWGGRGEKE